jgi:two-component sensor histidine kinase/PAS domain-containing protein
MDTDMKLTDLSQENRRLAIELAETREVLRAIRRGEVDALVSSEGDALYGIQLAALAIDKAESYLDSLVLLMRQLCVAGGWQYGEAWTASSDRQSLRRTSAWYGGCSDAIRLRECMVRLLFEEAPQASLMQALETGKTQTTRAEDLPAGGRAEAVAQCGFQAAAVFPIVVSGEVTAVLWLWARERQAPDSAALLRGEEIIAECAPLLQRKREEEILRFTVGELEVAVRERSREVARLSRQQQDRSQNERRAAGHATDAPAATPGAPHAGLLGALLDSLSEGVVVADHTGRVVQCNQAAQEILGDDPPGAISLDLWPDVYGLYDADKVTRLDYEDMPLARAMRGSVVDRMEIFVRNGACPEGRTLEMSARPLAGEGGSRGALAVFEDVTQRRSVDDARLQRALAQRDTLLREVHHRIKNNLAAVIELLLHHTRDEPRFQKIVAQVEPQLRAIATVHGLKAGTDAMVRLGPLVKSVTDNTVSLHGAKVDVAVADSLKALRLREEESVPLALVLNELLVNARKHGSGDPLEVQVAPDGQGVMLTVANNVASGARVPELNASGTDGHGISLVRSLLPHDRASLEFRHAGNRVSAIVRLAPDVFGDEPAPGGKGK